MAIAESHLAAVYNQPGYDVIDHTTYAIVTDGDLMEGVASEAASLAGHLRLGKLIYLYDDNHISIEGSTDLAFTEDRAMRFASYGWHILHVPDGNDVEAIDQAIRLAKGDPRPSLILCRTTIGYGLPTRQGTAKAHGEPPGDEELNGAKHRLGWPIEPRFFIPADVLEFFRQAEERGAEQEREWNAKFANYGLAFPEKANELQRRLAGALPEGWVHGLPEFPADGKGIATRVASGKVLNALAAKLPELMGGSADLAPSTNTWLTDFASYQAGEPKGRNLQYGVREHGMGAVVNGMAYHGGVIPYGATFLVFSDYMRGSIRISAISHLQSIWVFTHDSIGLGEDGPTHQPVEHLAALRAIPNLTVIRPADANETREAWKAAITNSEGPTVLALSRQAVPTLDRGVFADAVGLHHGAYVLADLGDKAPEVILMASGSEVELIMAAGKTLVERGVAVRLVSFPSWELFEAQSVEYRESVLPKAIVRRVAIEAGVGMGWEKWTGSVGKILCLNHYGASAPYKQLYTEFGLTSEAVVEEALALL
jgi:transketolase